MKRSVFALSFLVLFVELSFIHVYNVLLFSQLSYLVIAGAFLGFSFAAIPHYLIKKKITNEMIYAVVATAALSLLCFVVFVKTVSVDFVEVIHFNWKNLLLWLVLQVFTLLPFLCAGFLLLHLFLTRFHQLAELYYFDLLGAGVATLIFPFLLKALGADQAVMLISALLVPILWLLSRNKKLKVFSVVVTLIVVSVFAVYQKKDFYAYVSKWLKPEHQNHKRLTFWDSLGRVDVVGGDQDPVLEIFYDGGSTGTRLFRFDGDFVRLKQIAESDPELQFTRVGSLAAHVLKEKNPHSVFQIGVGAGQETKAAILYNANRVIGVDINPSVLDLLKHRLSEASGHIYSHPNVQIINGDGREALLRFDEKFDIIQIFSTYMQSGYLKGRGGLEANYLFTVDSFVDYFSKLKSDGILQLNHFSPEKFGLIGALAWKQWGRDDFHRHLVIFEDIKKRDIIPTLLIKMSPWTQEEINLLQQLFSLSKAFQYHLTWNPLNFEKDSPRYQLFDGFYPEDLKTSYPYNLTPATDDRPFVLNFFNRHFIDTPENIAKLPQVDRDIYMAFSKEVTRKISFLYWAPYIPWLLLILALSFSFKKTAAGWRLEITKLKMRLYFSLIGVAFIGLQYYFLFKLVKVLDAPFASVSFVIGVFLLLSGFGNRWLSGHFTKRWYSAVFAILTLIYYFGFSLAVDQIASFSSYSLKLLATVLVMTPITLFTGPFFPHAYSHIHSEDKSEQIQMWMLNGIATALGGFVVMWTFVDLGFQSSLLVTGGLYLLAKSLLKVKFAQVEN